MLLAKELLSLQGRTKVHEVDNNKGSITKCRKPKHDVHWKDDFDSIAHSASSDKAEAVHDQRRGSGQTTDRIAEAHQLGSREQQHAREEWHAQGRKT